MNTPEDLPFEETVNEAIDRVRGQLGVLNAIIESQRDYPVIHGDRVRLVEVIRIPQYEVSYRDRYGWY